MGLAIKVEDMAHEAEVLKSMALATYVAIYDSCDSYKGYDGALYAVCCMAHDHTEHLKTLLDEVYKQQGKEAEETNSSFDAIEQFT